MDVETEMTATTAAISDETHTERDCGREKVNEGNTRNRKKRVPQTLSFVFRWKVKLIVYVHTRSQSPMRETCDQREKQHTHTQTHDGQNDSHHSSDRKRHFTLFASTKKFVGSNRWSREWVNRRESGANKLKEKKLIPSDLLLFALSRKHPSQRTCFMTKANK